MRKIKHTILVLTVGLNVVTVSGQTIKDYYIPEASYNKAMFYSPDETGERTEMTRTIWYVNNDDDGYDVLDAHLMDGQPTSIITRTVQFSSMEVKMTKSVSTTILETNKKTNYSLPLTLLKMPTAGQTIAWSTVMNEGGKPTKFISSWTTVTVNGEKKQAIKVIAQYTGMTGKTISYYVKGIGLWKTEIVADGTTTTFDKFDGLTHESTK